MLEKNGTYVLCPKEFLFSLSVKKSREIGRACGTYWRREKYLQGSWLEKVHVEDLAKYGRIILNWI
jgi:hypothetical protein